MMQDAEDIPDTWQNPYNIWVDVVLSIVVVACSIVISYLMWGK